MDYEAWAKLSDEELAARDIAELNLETARGLPGANGIDVPALVAKVDAWASLVASGISRAAHKRHLASSDTKDTWAQYCVLAMVSILQRHCGVRYNLDFMEGEYDARDSRNLFIHGLLTGHGGTCVTMPVLYAAIGRRLGWPIRIVHLKDHCLCRWDEPGERFNIEATSRGFFTETDEYYQHWPQEITDAEMAEGFYLRSLTPREELASIFRSRGAVALDNRQLGVALKAFYWAAQLCPRFQQDWAMAWAAIRITHAMRMLGPDAPTHIEDRIASPEERYDERVVPMAKREMQRIARLWNMRDRVRSPLPSIT